MVYEVSVTAPAERDLYVAFERIQKVSPTRAEAWLTRLFVAIQTLDQMPLRCPLIPESDELGFEARHLLFGRGRGTYRIIFRLLESERQVQILRVWHGFRQDLTAEDVELD